MEARDFRAVATIVTTDFEALYAYKHGGYQLCLQRSSENVHTLLNAKRVPVTIIMTNTEFIQLLDDDIVSMIALAVIVHPNFRNDGHYTAIDQLTLSLYLMTQCQLKLRHSLTSVTQTLDYTEDARKRHQSAHILDHLSLKLIERKVLSCIGHCS